jgi:hypothetical protein
VLSAFYEVSHHRQAKTHEAVPNQARACSPLGLGECHEVGRDIATDIAVECHPTRGPDAIEDREYQQRVFGRVPERLSLFDQNTRPLYSRLAFRRSIAFHMMERINEGDLQLDLLATQRGCSAQRRDKVNCAGKLGSSFEQRGTLQRRCPALPHHSMAVSIMPA